MFIEKEKKGFFGRLSEKLTDALFSRQEVDEDMMERIEEALITSDVGMETTLDITDKLREFIKENMITLPKNVKKGLMNIITGYLDKGGRNKLSEDYPLVILMVGVNGGGKTTTIAKLGNMLKKDGKSVVFAAADTFRAAAGKQLEIWGDLAGVKTVSHDEGSDPGSVLYDAIQSAKSRSADVLICDTAGRLQTKKNLMDELAKMNRIIDREYPEASRETLLVIDASNGKNAVSMAKEFNEAAELSGVVITKLDGTAKGGIAITISQEFDLPIKFIGTGEGIDDIEIFDPESFAGEIFAE